MIWNNIYVLDICEVQSKIGMYSMYKQKELF